MAQGLVASSHDANSPCDLLQGPVAGTSPLVCADLYGLSLFNYLFGVCMSILVN